MIDCTRYENCPKSASIQTSVPNDHLKFIFLGCWGVYCKGGENPLMKIKINKETNTIKTKIVTVEYGEEQVSNLMAEYSNQVGGVNAVILAGDNVYTDYPTEEQTIELQMSIEKANEIKNGLFNMPKQIEYGFETCFLNKIKTNDYLMGIGNHDIENCDVLNTQINYKGWTMPGLYYNYIYNTNTMSVNLVFIDTNIYDDVYCTGNFPENARREQNYWLQNVLESNQDKWNIVIGHIPFMCNSHKENILTRIEPKLEEDIRSVAHLIDVYMCADEHNQQYITIPGMPPQIISGSGGAVLDLNIQNSPELQKPNITQLARATFGFVGVDIYLERIDIKFYSIMGNQPAFFTIIKKRD